ncbi:DKNYY domain-containing protein [Pseudoalteromonas sp. S558]|uniref:DKNYY domain-containing protein n=1 Tax=Pseudoalteromonas sp. S558 TaxID=2066515 RepID=UPI00110ADA9E|nr:DKNYY domain-containing protein [Pseudoalteromonas sp. S558]TMN95631.1 hypothetical protein CWB66_18305 [Pseudoalteromonas sp. S558]
MKILIWIGIIFLVIPLVGVLIALIIGLYVNNPSTHNATAFDSKISNQYYLRDGKVVYVLDGNFFQIGGSPIEGADPDTFSVISQSYAKGSNSVYYDGRQVEGADPSSIQLVTSGINASKYESGYLISGGKVFCYGQVMEDADAASFSYLLGSYAMDKEYLYYYIDVKFPRKTMPEAIKNANERYLRHGEQVIYQGKIISNEASRFKIINDEYAVDGQHVYSHGEIVEGMVPDGFTVITPYYRKDKNQAYYFNTPIPESDPSTFKVLNDSVAKDDKHVYYNGYIVDNRTVAEVSRSDASELEKMWKWNSLHLSPTRVILVPTDDIKDITNNFYVYNNEVYSRNNKLLGVKPEDVVILDDGKTFVRIGSQIFYYNAVVEGADPNTFTVIADRFSKDAKHVYWEVYKVVDADPLTFEYEENLYADENDAGEYYLKRWE